MKIYITLILFLIQSTKSYAQKPAINTDNVRRWEHIGKYCISPNGKYAAYEYSDYMNNDSLNLITINGQDKTAIPNGNDPFFSNNSKYLFYKIGDKYVKYNLRSKSSEELNGVKKLKFCKSVKSNFIALIYGGSLKLYDLESNWNEVFDKALDLEFSYNGNVAVVRGSNSIFWCNLANKKVIEIYKGGLVSSIALYKDNSVTFIVDGKKNREIFYYSQKSGESKLLVSDDKLEITKHCTIDLNTPKFSGNGNNIIFNVIPTTKASKQESGFSKLSIWHYKDRYLQSRQKALLNFEELQPNKCLSIDIGTKKCTSIGVDNLELSNILNDYVVIKNTVNTDEFYWTNSRTVYRLQSLISGEVFKFMSDSGILVNISNNKRFIIWRDAHDTNQSLFIFDTVKKRTFCLTDSIDSPLSLFQNDKVSKSRFRVTGWTSNDERIIIYDAFDIWIVDPLGAQRPINLTQGYGRQKQVKCTLVTEPDSIDIRGRNIVWISYFDLYTKKNGFINTYATNTAKVEVGDAFPRLIFSDNLFLGAPLRPSKGPFSDCYLLTQESDTDARNLYSTRDFKNFRKLSNFAPQKDINWLTAELVHWASSLSKTHSGILYKPENFDKAKKYPVIFHYYEYRTDERYQFPNTSSIQPGTGGLDVAWYVSNGYCVFVPDIMRYQGNPGTTAIETVVSAAKFLIQNFPWVDGSKLGLQGHSFGGYETNYIVTHSNLFAAAQSSSAPSDLVSAQGSLIFDGKSGADSQQVGQMWLGASLWENPYLYLESSPIFSADRVSTPILIMHGNKDGVVPFSQGVEFFTSLRRLKKKAWMLEYEDQGHILDYNSEASQDFAIRQKQFFDHYLKDKPAPLWMLEESPQNEKSLSYRLRLDSLNRIP